MTTTRLGRNIRQKGSSVGISRNEKISQGLKVQNYEGKGLGMHRLRNSVRCRGVLCRNGEMVRW